MVTKVRAETCSVNAVYLPFAKKNVVVDDIETLAQVHEAQKRYFPSVDGTKDVIGDDCQGGFGGMAGTEAMLSGGEEMIG